MLPFLCTDMTNEIFHWFGIKDIAKEQLKISEIGKIKEQIVPLMKYEGIFSGVLVILSFKWLTHLIIS